MVKRSQRSSEQEPKSGEPTASSREPTPAGDEKVRPGARRPYRRPQLQKRRSVAEATLFSGSGVSGTLVS